MSDQDKSIFDNEDNPADDPNKQEETKTPEEENKGEENKQTPDESSQKEKEDAYKDLLASIKREDGTQKYASVEDAFKALQNSQEFIEQLKTENSELRDKATSNYTVEQLMDQMSEAKKSNEEDPSKDSANQVDLEELVSNVLTKKEQETLRRNNAKRVIEAMTSQFGEKAEETYISKAEELGVSVSFLNDVAQNSPKAALELLGVKSKQQKEPSKLDSSVRTEKFQGHEPVKPKSAMNAPNSKDLLDSWRYAGEKVKEQSN